MAIEIKDMIRSRLGRNAAEYYTRFDLLIGQAEAVYSDVYLIPCEPLLGITVVEDDGKAEMQFTTASQEEIQADIDAQEDTITWSAWGPPDSILDFIFGGYTAFRLKITGNSGGVVTLKIGGVQ